MGRLLSFLFNPPPMPPLELPLPARMIAAVSKAFELVYYRGVLDGVFAGAILALILMTAIRSRATKGE